MTFVFGMVIDWKLAPRPCRLCILVFPFLVHSTDSQSFGMTVNRSPSFLSFSVGFYYGNDAVQRQAPQHASLQKLPERRAGLCDWLIVIFNGESCTSTPSVVMLLASPLSFSLATTETRLFLPLSHLNARKVKEKPSPQIQRLSDRTVKKIFFHFLYS